MCIAPAIAESDVREVVLLGLQGDNATQRAVIVACREFDAHIVARSLGALVVQFCGRVDSAGKLIASLAAGGISRTCRSPLLMSNIRE